MTFTLATRRDLDAIASIYAEARAYMKETGNADQWGTRYPEAAQILRDIDENSLYTVGIDGEIAAVIIDDEATLKRVKYNKEKQQLTLFPANDKYDPLVFIGEELNQIRILGKAVCFMSNL